MLSMNSFHQLLTKVYSSRFFDQMQQFVAPLNDHLGINHFWYYKITFSGNYSFLGSHAAWVEYSFDKPSLQHFPCLRHPEAVQRGITLMKAGANEEYQTLLDDAWKKFQINFNINLVSRIHDGIEAFGFASRFNDPYVEQKLLNVLPFLSHFIQQFRLKHKKLFRLVEDNQVNLPAIFGQRFYERPQTLSFPMEYDKLLYKLGFKEIFLLTAREKDVLRFIADGYPAAYIANQLHLQTKTIENYIVTIKCKLDCHSKVELIKKAKECLSVGFLSIH